MDKTELDIILKEGEGYKVEFKEGINSLDKEIVAFANASGGKILLGVADDGTICKQENAPFPHIEFNENYFYVTFKQSNEYLKLAGEIASGLTQKVPRKYPESLTPNQIEILKLLENVNNLTRAQLAKKLNISSETIKKNIEKLKKAGLLKRIGPDRGGH